MNSINKTSRVGIGLAVHYSVAVLNPDGTVADSRRRKSNLLLDTGLDLAATSRFAALFTYAAVGTSANPVKRDSGAITFTRSADTVTASANFFEAGDVGRLLKFDSGEEMYITAFTDAQTVTVNESGTLGASEGTIWYVNLTGLAAETKRTNTYGSDSGDNGSTYSAPLKTWTMKRTFIFSAESTSVTYREIGWGPSSTPGSNLLGRDVLAGGGVSLISGQQLKVVVELSFTFAPNEPTEYTNVVTGWSQDGDCCIEDVNTGTAISAVNTNGSTPNVGGFLEPSETSACVLSTLSGALVSMGISSQPDTGKLVIKEMSLATYVAGSFTRRKSVTFTVSEGNSTSIRSIWLTSSTQANNRGFRVLLDAAETKDSAHRLTLRFDITWGRVLTN